jgi:hypothetical protein
MSIIRGLPRWTGERTLVVRGQLETLTWRQYRKRCGEIRRIWIKVVSDDGTVAFGEDQLSLEWEEAAHVVQQ